MSAKDFSSLTGAQKAAIVLLSLPEENATKILAMMTDEEIREISYVMSNLGTVESSIVDKVLSKFNEEINLGSTFWGSLQAAERLLSRIMHKDEVQALLDEIKGPQGRSTWEKLSNVSEETLAMYLSNEHPQVAALVLSKMKAEYVAKVLTHMNPLFAMDVINRILNISQVNKGVLTALEQKIRNEFIHATDRKSSRYDSFAMMAQVFNNLDQNTASKYIHMLEERDLESATKIRNLMFTFEDFVKIDQGGIQKILRAIDKSKLTFALKGASHAIKQLFLSNMSQRAARLINEEMESMGPVRMTEVSMAREHIISTAKRLIAEGEIVVFTAVDDQYVS